MNINWKKIAYLAVAIIIAASAVTAYLVFFKGYSLFGLKEALIGERPGQSEVKKDTSSVDGRTAVEEPIKKINISENGVGINQVRNENNNNSQSFGKDDLRRMAASFAERFGSYSNQSNYSNISNLKIFMSRKMTLWADEFIKDKQEAGLSDIYYGITTKAISQDIKEFDDNAGAASVLVITRRREASGSTNNVSNIFNQNITVNFVKENGIWKVDSANWQM